MSNEKEYKLTDEELQTTMFEIACMMQSLKHIIDYLSNVFKMYKEEWDKDHPDNSNKSKENKDGMMYG